MATKAPKTPSKGGVLGSKVHGVPTIAIVAGGGVAVYLLYKHFSSSSSTPSSTSVPAYYPSGNPPGSGSGSSGGASGYPYPGARRRQKAKKGAYKSTLCSCPEVPYGARTVPGPGPCYCAQVVGLSGQVPTSTAPKTTTSTSRTGAASTTSIPVVTQKSAAAGQTQLVSANQARSAGVTPAATKAYNQLTSNPAWAAQPQSVVAQTAAQTAAGTGNGPNAYYGAPGSPSTLTTAQISSMNARNHVNPNLGNATQQAIAATAAQNPQNFGGGWTNVGNGTIRNNQTGQVLPAGTNGIW